MSDEREMKMTQFRNQAEKQLNETGVSSIDTDLLDELCGRMKPVIMNQDATLVSGTDESELETVRTNYVVKHLGVDDKDKGMSAVKEVAEAMSGIRMKNRAAFYYHLNKKLK